MQVDSDDQYINDARSVRGLTLALVFMCMLTVTQMMQARAASTTSCRNSREAPFYHALGGVSTLLSAGSCDAQHHAYHDAYHIRRVPHVMYLPVSRLQKRRLGRCLSALRCTCFVLADAECTVRGAAAAADDIRECDGPGVAAEVGQVAVTRPQIMCCNAYARRSSPHAAQCVS